MLIGGLLVELLSELIFAFVGTRPSDPDLMTIATLEVFVLSNSKKSKRTLKIEMKPERNR